MAKRQEEPRRRRGSQGDKLLAQHCSQLTVPLPPSLSLDPIIHSPRSKTKS
jgi:hypothetical protein